jgi:hypothetical protein
MIKRFREKIKEIWYFIRYGVIIDYFVGSLPAISGEGQFVSIRKNGPYLEISKDDGMIRITPFLPTHGVVVEYISPSNRTFCRKLIDYDELKLMVCEKNQPTEEDAQKIYTKRIK